MNDAGREFCDRLLLQHDAHWRAIADALGGKCCGGVDCPVETEGGNAQVLIAEIEKLKSVASAADGVLEEFMSPPGEVAHIFACFPQLHKLAITLTELKGETS